MMEFALWCRDVPGTGELRRDARPRHLARLEALAAEGRLLLAGPFPGAEGVRGSLIVARFTSLEDARSWAGQDPYQLAGVYASVEIEPFRQVLPVPAAPL